MGKSTTASNLAQNVAMLGLRVLLVDADAQGQAGLFLGLEPEPKLHTWLAGNLLGFKTPLSDIVAPSGRLFLDVILGNRLTEMTDRMLANIDDNRGKQDWLKTQIRLDVEFFSQYDVVVWDTAPSGRLLSLVLDVADLVIIPVTADRKGQAALSATLIKIPVSADRIILPNRISIKQKVDRAVLDEWIDLYGKYLFYTNAGFTGVPERAAIQQAQALGKTLVECPGDNDATGVFRALARQVVDFAFTEVV